MRSFGTAGVVTMAWILVASVTPREAHAQTDGWLAVGAGVLLRANTSDQAAGNVTPIPVVRVGRGGDGWGVRFGLNWFATDVERGLDGRTQAFGRLQVRPIMLGYGYGRRYGRARVSFNLKAGYAFSSFRLQPGFADTYSAALGTTGVRVDASNTFVIKPDVVAWIDISRSVGLNIGAGYIVARPHVALNSAAGSERRRMHADVFMLQVGAVYSVF